MASRPLRLLHAANLQLDFPLQGVGPVNDDIREVVDGATLIAYDRMVTTAIDKDVDGVLITGNTFDATYPSLAAEVAMREGFERLGERNIPVFIAPGQTDPASAWLDMPRLPDNVTVFTDVSDPPVDLTDHGHLLAALVPVTSSSSIDPEELSNILRGRKTSKGDRPFVVGLLLPEASSGHRENSKQNASRFAALDWLVCAAGIDGDLLPLTDGKVHAQIATQGLSRTDTGVRGVTLLEVDSNRKQKQTLVPTAPIRWESFVQKIDGAKGRDELLERMLGQLEKLPSLKGEQVRFIHWKLDRTTGDSHGWEADSAAKELADALTDLSDQPDGLRYVHRVEALEPDLTLIEPAHREVLTEYLLALERRAPANQSVFMKWVTDARVGDVLNSGRWEHWTESISPKEVTERAQQLGWKWFTMVGKK